MTTQELWLVQTFRAARAAGHIFPDYAACEAANEAAWGQSKLAKLGANLFGTKQHSHPEYKTLNLPTKEFLDHKWVVIKASWVCYPSEMACFQDRMYTLRRLSPMYPHYAAALVAKDGTTFVDQVSLSWATDPDRARKVLSIYHAHGHLLK